MYSPITRVIAEYSVRTLQVIITYSDTNLFVLLSTQDVLAEYGVSAPGLHVIGSNPEYSNRNITRNVLRITTDYEHQDC